MESLQNLLAVRQNCWGETTFIETIGCCFGMGLAQWV